MEEKQIEKMLYELAQATAEPVRPGLADDIKRQTPERLTSHKVGRGTINIVIDLKISKLAAAAVIIIAILLFANLLNGRSLVDDGMLNDGRLMLKYIISGDKAVKSDVFAGLSVLYENLNQQGIEAVYYGGKSQFKNPNSILMHWKLEEGKYRVIFADLHQETVNSEELIRLQANMLQEK